MIHGPCGDINKRNSCMVNGQCKSHYPRQFCETTTQEKDGYPIYRRKNDGKTIDVRRAKLNNQWVVPHNPYLLLRYDCHITIEVCSGLTAVKYLYKYIYKGHDKVAVHIAHDDGDNIIDEIKNFQDARWVSAQEALWRIFEFDLNEISPAVINLPLHLPNKQCVTFWKNQNLKNVLQWDHASKTMLTEFFHIGPSSFDNLLTVDGKICLTFKEAAQRRDAKKDGLFFVDGPEGTGKTYLYCALLANVRSRKMIALATATSGVAASILSGIQKPFGGKVVVLGGDFMQVLPVVLKASVQETINASLVKSYLYKKMYHLTLSKNMRARSNPLFSDFFLRVGNGTECLDADGNIQIPDNMVIKYDEDDDEDFSEQKLIDHIFPNLEKHFQSADYMTNRAILASKNEYVDKLNEKIIRVFPDEARKFTSFDEAVDDTQNIYPSEFLNSLTPNGMPPYRLVLKKKLYSYVVEESRSIRWLM
ncbi:uncharacterized protein [Henckelia pumila]|uniref:uncharacterized protein n=1 Tax=Henckelia pumila TaxID=405737 RepID=UPI003C6DBEAA